MTKFYLVSEQIENEIPLNKVELNTFFSTLKDFLEKIEIDNIEAINRRGVSISPKETFEFFRSQDRINNTKLILEYLISFIVKLPLKEDIVNEEVNPFDQIKQFLKKTMKLLKERDVRDAILNEHDRVGVLNDNNLWYYRGRIDQTYKEIGKLMKNVIKPDYPDYKNLFLSIQILSKYWFSQRNEDLDRIRKSDIYLYKLAAILIDIIDSSTATADSN